MAVVPIPAVSRIALTVDGYEIAAFTELAGLSVETEVAETLESSDAGVTRSRLPVRSKPPTVSLKRAASSALELWAWYESVQRGDLAKAQKSATLTMYATDGKPVVKYWLEKAWPSKLELSPLKAGPAPLMESITLTCEYLQRIAP